jgi:hypothetical protein
MQFSAFIPRGKFSQRSLESMPMSQEIIPNSTFALSVRRLPIVHRHLIPWCPCPAARNAQNYVERRIL